MILIIGSSHDDVLYFESKLRNKRTEMIYKKYKITFGTIFNQEIALVHEVYTSYLSSLLTAYVMQKYYVVLVLLVGKCVALFKDVRPGDVFLSRQIFFGDVNQYGKMDSSLGQIPTLPRFFSGDNYVLSVLETAFNNLSELIPYRFGTFITTNKIIKSEADVLPFSRDNVYFGRKDALVFDSETGGAALSCYLAGVSFVSVKVVEHYIGEESTVDSYVEVLKRYSFVGKAISAAIGEITRNDVKQSY